MSTLRVTNIQDLAGNDVFSLSGGNMTISGDLTVQGTTTSIETTNLQVEDKNIILGLTTPAADDLASDGGGITLKGSTDKTITWSNTSGSWETNVGLNVLNGFVGVGTSNPGAKLSVTTSSNWNFPQVFLKRDASNTGNNIKMIAFGLEADSSSQATASSASFIGLNTDTAPTTGNTVLSQNAKLNLTSPGGVIMPVGDVGIGTDSPTVKLDINGTAKIRSAQQLQFNNSDNTSGCSIQAENTTSVPALTFNTFGQERLRIDSSGRLLVGTISTSSYPNFNGTTVNPLLQVTSDTDAETGILLRFNSAGAGSNRGATFCFQRYTDGTSVSDGKNLGEITWQGEHDGSNTIAAASIRAHVDGASGSSDMPGRLVFSTTADGASSPTERMRITNEGRVCVADGGGTTNARFKVGGNSLYSPTTSAAFVQISTQVASNTTSAATMADSYVTTEATSFTVTDIQHFSAGQGTIGAGSTVTNQFGFRARSSLTGATNNYGFRSEIASGTNRWNFYASGTADNYFGGNVGIGTATPAAQLHTYRVATQGWRLRLDTDVSDGAGFFQRSNGDFELVLRDSSNNNNLIVGAAGNISILPTINVGIGEASPNSKLAVNGSITESTDGGTTYHNVVTAQDVGTDPNQVPLNQFLGQLAFMDQVGDIPTASSPPQDNLSINFEYVSNTSIKIRMRGTDGVVRSVTLTLS